MELKKSELVEVAIALLGIYLAVQAFLQVPTLWADFRIWIDILGSSGSSGTALPPSDTVSIVKTTLATVSISVAIAVAVGVLLIRGRRWIARRLFGESSSASISTTAPSDLYAFALAAAGVLMVAYALPDLADIALRLAVRHFEAPTLALFGPSWTDLSVGIAAVAARLVVGAGLYLGSRGIVNAWYALRTVGTSDDEALPPGGPA